MKNELKASLVKQVINDLDKEHEIRMFHRSTLEYWVTRIFEELITYAFRMGTAKSEELWELDDVYKNLMEFIQLLEQRKEEKNEI